MAKVIGKNKKHVLEATCRQCASIVEFTRNEAKLGTVHDYGGGSDDYYFLKCPACGYKMNLGSYLK